MSDIFGRADQVLGGGLSSDSLFLTWPALGQGQGLGLYIQRVGIEYAQRVRRVFELGPGEVTAAGRRQRTYYIIERPEGRLQFSRFVGPGVICSEFYRKYGNPCNPNNTITLSGQAGCSPGAPAPVTTWTLSGVLLDRMNVDITAQEMVIQDATGAQFVGLNLEVNSPDCISGQLSTGAIVAPGTTSGIVQSAVEAAAGVVSGSQ